MPYPAEITVIKCKDVDSGITYDVHPEGENPCLTYRPACDYPPEHNLLGYVKVKNNTGTTAIIGVRFEDGKGLLFEKASAIGAGQEWEVVKNSPLISGCPSFIRVIAWVRGREAEAHKVEFPITEGFVIVNFGVSAVVRGETKPKPTVYVALSPPPKYTILAKGISVYSPGITVTVKLTNVPFVFNVYYASSQDPYWVGKTGYDWTSPLLPKDATWTLYMDKNKGIWHWLMPGPPPAWMPWEDINMDGIVDIFDVVQVALKFGTTRDDPEWDEKCDIVPDGTIDIFDLVKLALTFGSSDQPLPRKVTLSAQLQAQILSAVNQVAVGSTAIMGVKMLTDHLKKAVRR